MLAHFFLEALSFALLGINDGLDYLQIWNALHVRQIVTDRLEPFKALICFAVFHLFFEDLPSSQWLRPRGISYFRGSLLKLRGRIFVFAIRRDPCSPHLHLNIVLI